MITVVITNEPRKIGDEDRGHRTIVTIQMPLKEAQELLHALSRINWKTFSMFPSVLHSFFLRLKDTSGIRQ